MNNQALRNATQNWLSPKLVEGALKGNTGLSYFLVRGKAGSWNGNQVEIPFKFQENPNGGSFSGMQLLSTGEANNQIMLTFNPKFVEQPTVLAKTDLSVNNTKMGVANLMKRQVASDTADLAQKLGRMFYGDGTGNSGLDILGLGAIVDDGASVATIGGQSRATYPALQSDVTAATNGILDLATMYAADDAATEANETPDLVLTTKAIFSMYNRLLDPKERYMVDVTGPERLFLKTGAKRLAFRTAQVVADSLCPTGLMFFLNSESFEFLTLPYYGGKAVNFAADEMEGLPSPDVVDSLGFYSTDWIPGQNQEGLVMRTVLSGNFAVKNPRYNAKITGITGIN